MKTVQIADDVYAGLQRLAVPFEDEINDVLRRLLRQAGEIVEHQLADRMSQHDGEMLAAGITRWQSQARNARTQLQYEGRIESVGDGWYQYRG